MRTTWLSLLAGALLLTGGICRADEIAPPAKELKPVAVVSLAGYDAVKNDVNCIGALMNNPGLADGLEAMQKLMMQGKGFDGLDKTRPWGFTVQSDGENFSDFSFLPVTNADALGKVLEPMIGKPEDLGNKVYKIQLPHNPHPIFCTEKNGWLFFSQFQEILANVPDDPLPLLDGLEKQYDVAVRIHAGNISEAQRGKFIELLKGHLREADEQATPMMPMHAEMKKKLSEMSIQSLETTLKEMKEVTFGWKLDTQVQKTYIEIGLIAKENTPTAAKFDALAKAKSDFNGFRSTSAAVFGHWAGQSSPQKKEVLDLVFNVVRERMKMIEMMEPDPEKVKLVQQLVEKTTGLLQDTVQSGRVDGGMSLVLKPNDVTLATGGYVENNGRLEEIIQLVTDAVKKEKPEVGEWVKLNAAEFKGVKLHTISIPIPENVPERAKHVSMIGEKLEIVIGTGKQSVYVAVGRDPLKAIKDVIESSAGSTSTGTLPPVEISVSLDSIAQFVAAVGEDQAKPMAAALAEELKASPGRDHLTFVAHPVPQGVTYRLELEEGALKALVKVAAKTLHR